MGILRRSYGRMTCNSLYAPFRGAGARLRRRPCAPTGNLPDFEETSATQIRAPSSIAPPAPAISGNCGFAVAAFSVWLFAVPAAAQPARPANQCEAVVRTHAFLSRAQFQCRFEIYGQDMIDAARRCASGIPEPRLSELLRDGMELFDDNEQSRGGRAALCASILQDFPKVVSGPARPDSAQARGATARPDPAALIREWDRENGKCRGGSGDEDATHAACDARDGLAERLFAVGRCYGKRGEAGYQMRWHRCGRDSNR